MRRFQNNAKPHFHIISHLTYIHRLYSPYLLRLEQVSPRKTLIRSIVAQSFVTVDPLSIQTLLSNLDLTSVSTQEMTVRIPLQDPTPEQRILLSTLSTHISKSKRSVIVTGAGISCNAGIPVPFPPHLSAIDCIRTFARKMDCIILSKQSIPRQ